MTDRITKEQRSLNMSKVKGKNTSLELSVRKKLFSKGLRYTLHSRLPGKPDIVLPSRKLVVFVHGCFWHQHSCKKAALPTTNTEFWTKKLNGNKVRDTRIRKELKVMGWNVITLWECHLNNTAKFENTLNKLLKKITILHHI